MIKRQLVTEKTSQLLENNCYAFIVDDHANSISLKNYIEKKYGIRVKKVNMLKSRGKKVRRGRISGHSSDFKKAYVFTDSEIIFSDEGTKKR